MEESVEFPENGSDDRGSAQLPSLVKRVADMAEKAKGKATVVMQEGQMDLFMANLLDYSLKNDTASMEAPLFSLQTKPDLRIFKWESPDGKKWLTVTPSVIGRATIHDKDLLIYLTSQLTAAMNTALRNGTKMPGRRIRFTAHDFMVATRRDTGGKTYDSLEATLDRLRGTTLKTNVDMGDMDVRNSFGLIESYKLIVERDGKGKNRTTAVEVELSGWLYSALENKNVLTISAEYFSLRKPLEKRLYEIARKHVGRQPEWLIREESLHEKTGSQANPREFRRMLTRIIAEDTIPDYIMERLEGASGQRLVKVIPRPA